jgi:transcriptional repressor NrdR
MKCPFCGELEDRVIDSRLSQEGGVIRRRRECVGCERRYTTYERIEETLPLVVKKDGRREPFDRLKILAGLKRACEKRPVSSEALEGVVSAVERRSPFVRVRTQRTTSGRASARSWSASRSSDASTWIRTPGSAQSVGPAASASASATQLTAPAATAPPTGTPSAGSTARC